MAIPSSQVIIVTGASSGIGEEAVRMLVANGHRVYGGARRVEKMRPLADLGATVLALDVTKENSIVNFVDTVLKKEGRVDALVNNAGFGLYGAIEDVSIEEARHQFEVNLFGLARMTQLVLPTMREQESGTIVNISSIGGKVYTPMGAWYHATKHALEGWSDCLRLELAPFGIDVVIVEPGAIETEFDEVVLDPLRKRSHGGPYEDLANKMGEITSHVYDSGKASPPSLIAGVIQKAIESKMPKTRYLTGHMAWPVLIARRLLPDKVFDWMIQKAL